MNLKRFRVTDFRSVRDSGWIDTNRMTAMIGTNESGKTNLLIALWKLRPAKGGEISPMADYPRKRYTDIRQMPQKPVFIHAEFEPDTALMAKLKAFTGATEPELSRILITRDFDGAYTITFPDEIRILTVDKATVEPLVGAAFRDIDALTPPNRPAEKGKDMALTALTEAIGTLATAGDTLDVNQLTALRATLATATADPGTGRAASTIRMTQLIEQVRQQLIILTRPTYAQNDRVRDAVMTALPRFVYYSNYGNLDSEIYLPHVIANMNRTDLGSREEAKVRTLKVLFDFVGMRPDEVLELGRDLPSGTTNPTEAQIREFSARKREREVLLQSASVQLAQRFGAWWKQGNYRFRMQADGNHFRIWVADGQRPEEIELESRSSGLQWFLSFYLVFLSESGEGEGTRAVLLLDEPGLTLHPLAQEDLAEFFRNLCVTNQLLYTTHSPFLVNPETLDMVRSVFVDEEGSTAVSADLRAHDALPLQTKAVYPVYAAFGLRASASMFQGSEVVLVEGPEDQIYLSAIKTYLIARGLIHPQRELLFLPASGGKGMTAVIPLIANRDEVPLVVLNSDAIGNLTAKHLLESHYAQHTDRIHQLAEICGFEGAESEDLFPQDLVSMLVDRQLRVVDEEFVDVVKEGQPIMPQIEAFATKLRAKLVPGWKLELARRVKDRLPRNRDFGGKYPEYERRWIKLFSHFSGS